MHSCPEHWWAGYLSLADTVHGNDYSKWWLFRASFPVISCVPIPATPGRHLSCSSSPRLATSPIRVVILLEVRVTQSCPTLCHPMDIPWTRQSMGFSWPEHCSRWPCSSPGHLPNPRMEPGLPHCRQILCQLSQPGSQRILEWVAYPFSRGPSRPRNRTGIVCIVGGFFTNWAIREALIELFKK